MNPAAGQDIIPTLRHALQQQRRVLADTFQLKRNPHALLNGHSACVDNTIRQLWHNQQLNSGAALVAVGGYGRGELYPHSDVDVLILMPEDASPSLYTQIEPLIAALWDVGLEIGHSVRTITQCIVEAGQDLSIETALLEGRWVCGAQPLYHSLNQQLAQHRDPAAFVEAKQLEQQQRHHKYFGVANNLEPNVKEGLGGLRDLHTIQWIARAIGLDPAWSALAARGIITRDEARALRHSTRQLMRLRIDLHLTAKRREDRLIFDLQQQVAYCWQFADTRALRASEQLMQRYFRAARWVIQLNGILLPSLYQRLSSSLETRSTPINARFKAINASLALRDLDTFQHTPSAILEAFLLLMRHPELTGLTPRTLRALWHARSKINGAFRRDPANRALFMAILRENSGLTRTLRRMNLYGILERYLPAFGRIVGRMQHDLFHVYTVDEHILMVVRNLRRFAIPTFNHEYPLCSRLINEFERPELLYIAGLFHDIAKGRGGDHSELGMADARQFCQQHGLPTEDCELVVWLVREHLSLSSIAQKQDIYDPDTLRACALRIGTLRRLNALYLLTVADIRGTSPKLWNGWRAKLLEDLYHATHRVLTAGGEIDRASIIEERQTEARKQLRFAAIPDGVERPLWQQVDTVYFLRHEAHDIAWHARELNRAVNTPTPLVKARIVERQHGIEVLVYCPDQADLFARICRFFSRTAYSIADAKIYTTQHGYALDTFTVFIPEHHNEPYRDMIHFIEYELNATLTQDSPITVPRGTRINRHLKHFPINPQVSIRPDDKGHYYVLSVEAGDRPGLLVYIAHILSHYHISVHSAKIMTLGSRVEDAFLLTGEALKDDKTLLHIKGELLDVLQVCSDE